MCDGFRASSPADKKRLGDLAWFQNLAGRLAGVRVSPDNVNLGPVARNETVVGTLPSVLRAFYVLTENMVKKDVELLCAHMEAHFREALTGEPLTTCEQFRTTMKRRRVEFEQLRALFWEMVAAEVGVDDTARLGIRNGYQVVTKPMQEDQKSLGVPEGLMGMLGLDDFSPLGDDFPFGDDLPMGGAFPLGFGFPMGGDLDDEPEFIGSFPGMGGSRFS